MAATRGDGTGPDRFTLPGMDRYRDIVEEQLQEAMERGDFDDLSGTGRPLALGDDSPDWWARRKAEELRREQEVTETVRRLERDRDAIWGLSDEKAVRRAAGDLNRRIQALNPLLREDERLPFLQPQEAVTVWQRMARLRSTG